MDFQYTYVPVDADNSITCVLKYGAYSIARISIVFNNE